MKPQKPDTISREDRSLSHDDLEPAGFKRITRARPNKRPPGSEREREDTRRPKREGKW